MYIHEACPAYNMAAVPVQYMNTSATPYWTGQWMWASLVTSLWRKKLECQCFSSDLMEIMIDREKMLSCANTDTQHTDTSLPLIFLRSTSQSLKTHLSTYVIMQHPNKAERCYLQQHRDEGSYESSHPWRDTSRAVATHAAGSWR